MIKTAFIIYALVVLAAMAYGVNYYAELGAKWEVITLVVAAAVGIVIPAGLVKWRSNHGRRY